MPEALSQEMLPTVIHSSLYNTWTFQPFAHRKLVYCTWHMSISAYFFNALDMLFHSHDSHPARNEGPGAAPNTVEGLDQWHHHQSSRWAKKARVQLQRCVRAALVAVHQSWDWLGCLSRVWMARERSGSCKEQCWRGVGAASVLRECSLRASELRKRSIKNA